MSYVMLLYHTYCYLLWKRLGLLSRDLIIAQAQWNKRLAACADPSNRSVLTLPVHRIWLSPIFKNWSRFNIFVK